MATGAAIGGWFVKPRVAQAAGSPFTIALVPDPQYLAGDMTCSGSAAYNGLINWAITNRNLSVLGVPLNIKGFIQVGDCANTTSSTVFDAQQQRSVNAYALAEAATPKMFVTRCVGNHDYEGAGAVGSIVNANPALRGRAFVSYMWRTDKSGAWSPASLASIYSGGMDLGSGDTAVFGGVYTEPLIPASSANNYFRLAIQGMKIGVLSLEYFPRSAVLNWARGIQEAFPDHQWWVCTHGYQDITGSRCNSIPNGSLYGPSGITNSDFMAAPDSNTGIDMWQGSDATWSGFTTWRNLTACYCGHWLDGYTSPVVGGAGVGSWVWQRLPSASTSGSGQTVQQIFCNCQGASGTGDQSNYCSSNPATLNGTSDVMHLMLLRITPATQMMESFLVSTNSGKWTGPWTGSLGTSVNQTSPIQLFNVSMATPTAVPSSMFSGSVTVRGGVVR